LFGGLCRAHHTKKYECLVPGPAAHRTAHEIFKHRGKTAKTPGAHSDGTLRHSGGNGARAALLLASDDVSDVTGTTFTVDSGITAADVTPE